MLIGCHVGLRAIELDDLYQLLEWRNKPSFRRFFREYRELSKEQQRKWFDEYVVGDRNTIMFSIVSLESEQLLGACGLCYINWVDRNADFSIYIGFQDLYIDSMYTDDAAKIMMQFAFEELGLHRLWAEIYSFDEKKKAMFERLGFSLEGQHRDTHWTEGKWWDSLYYSRLLTEYESERWRRSNE